jgi:hypothetical protein
VDGRVHSGFSAAGMGEVQGIMRNLAEFEGCLKIRQNIGKALVTI